MRIYTASKTVHASKWRDLRDKEGLPIVSTWIDEADAGATSDWPDLWRRCISEASHATHLLLYAEPGEILKGALVEVGAALAAKVRVIVVGLGSAHSFQHHHLVTTFLTLREALDYLRTAKKNFGG